MGDAQDSAEPGLAEAPDAGPAAACGQTIPSNAIKPIGIIDNTSHRGCRPLQEERVMGHPPGRPRSIAWFDEDRLAILLGLCVMLCLALTWFAEAMTSL
jgi:hypothetical protein